MMFRPKYCCNCGEKIERGEWRLWTSRRFCDLCSTEYKHLDIFPPAFVCVGAFLTLLGVGTYFRSPAETAGFESSKPVTVSSKQLKPATLFSSNTASNEVNSDANSNTGQPGAVVSQNIEQPSRRSNTSEDAVYYCGALTKKGTPCTRRVKVKGYCWQHAKTGQIAPTRF